MSILAESTTPVEIRLPAATAYIRNEDGSLRVRGRGRPRPGEEIVYLTAAELEAGRLEPERPTAAGMLPWAHLTKTEFVEWKEAFEALWEPYLLPRDAAILHRILYHLSYETGRCFPRRNTLGKADPARKIRSYSGPTITAATDNLAALGIIEKHHARGQRKTHYVIHLDMMPDLGRLALVYPELSHSLSHSFPARFPVLSPKAVEGSPRPGKAEDGSSSSSLRDAAPDDDDALSLREDDLAPPPAEPGDQADVRAGARDAAQAVQHVIEVLAQWEINPRTLAARMAAECQARDVSMASLADAVIWWGSSGPGGWNGHTAGYLITSMPTIWGQYEQHQRQQAADQARAARDQARAAQKQEQAAQAELDRQEQERRSSWRRDHTWFLWRDDGDGCWREHSDLDPSRNCAAQVTRVSEERPAGTAVDRWLTRTEHERASELAGSANYTLTAEQLESLLLAAIG